MGPRPVGRERVVSIRRGSDYDQAQLNEIAVEAESFQSVVGPITTRVDALLRANFLLVSIRRGSDYDYQ